MIRVAINGFGRIGRAVFRIIAQRPESGIEIVAINDLADDDVLAYLLEYDSVMGPFGQQVEVADGVMTVGKHRVKMLMERDPAALPWEELDIDVVIEATGVFRTGSPCRSTRCRRQAGDPDSAGRMTNRPDRGARGQRLGARPLRRHRLQRLMHHQLPGAARQGAGRGVRDQAGLDDDRPRLHQRSAARRRAPQGSPSQPGRHGEHHPDHHRCGQGRRQGLSETGRQAPRHGHAGAGARRLNGRPGRRTEQVGHRSKRSTRP